MSVPRYYPQREHWNKVVRLCRDNTRRAAEAHASYRRAEGTKARMSALHRYNIWRTQALSDLRLLEEWAYVPRRPASVLKPRLEYLSQ